MRTGIIEVLRRLHTAGSAPLHALGGAAVQPALHCLRDFYGMAEEEADGHWHLRLAPQWLALPPHCAGLPVQVHDELPSTQPAAAELPAPAAVFAEHQTAGIGQHGRGWLGLPADAIAVSLRLPAPAQPGGLSVALGAVLCTALSPQLRFKWPNDLVTAQGHKVGGILTQIKGDALLVGIGINWRMTSALQQQVAALGNTAAALADLPSAEGIHTRQQAAEAVVHTVVQSIAAYAQEGFAAFRTMAEAVHVAPCGAPLQVDGADKTFLGFAEDGALLTGGGRVLSGQTQYVAGG